MPVFNYRVLYHSEVNGKFDAHFGHRSALVAAADALDSGGSSRPVPANIAAALQNNSLHNTKPSAVLVLDNVANLDGPSSRYVLNS